jgi:hypothetical protein
LVYVEYINTTFSLNNRLCKNISLGLLKNFLHTFFCQEAAVGGQPLAAAEDVKVEATAHSRACDHEKILRYIGTNTGCFFVYGLAQILVLSRAIANVSTQQC